VLDASGRTVYGFGSDFDSREARFLRSEDGGRSWTRPSPPEPLLSLAIAVRVVPGTAEALPLDDESVDAVLASLVLCTVPDQAAALAEAWRVIRRRVSLPRPATAAIRGPCDSPCRRS
jgi:SAM-dependent methyltransferase